MALAFTTMAAARAGFKDMLDAAQDGSAGLVSRDGRRYAVVGADDLHEMLRPATPTPEVFFEDGRVGLVIPGAPLATEADTLDEATADMLDALRDYAADWPRLRHAPNHSRNRALVMFVEVSTDEQLTTWLTGGEDEAA